MCHRVTWYRYQRFAGVFASVFKVDLTDGCIRLFHKADAYVPKGETSKLQNTSMSLQNTAIFTCGRGRGVSKWYPEGGSSEFLRNNNYLVQGITTRKQQRHSGKLLPLLASWEFKNCEEHWLCRRTFRLEKTALLIFN